MEGTNGQMKPILSVDEFLDLIGSSLKPDRQRVRLAEAGEEVWLRILQEYPELKRSVVLNKTLPEKIIRILAADVDPQLRADVAEKRGLPKDLFTTLAEDEDASVRARIAWNAKTPVEVLRKLATDGCEIVSEPARTRLQREN